MVFGRPNEALVELMPLEEATLQETPMGSHDIHHFKTPCSIHVVSQTYFLDVILRMVGWVKTVKTYETIPYLWNNIHKPAILGT